MTKLVLAGVVWLGFTACDERVGRGIKAPTAMPLSMQEAQKHTQKDYVKKEMPVPVQSEETLVVKDIPILEDELPILSTVQDISEPIVSEKGVHKSKKIPTFTEGTSSLDIANIRISNSPERTRVVFDTYTAGSKASVSGLYSYHYDASKKSITLTLKDYKSISALGSSKTRTYPAANLVKNIYLQNTTQANTIKCVIALRDDASVHVFDIKEPGRIVIDISPH